MTVTTLLSVLAVWMLICGWCGYRMRVALFLGALLVGLALNMGWMMFGLNARPLEQHALMAEASVFIYGITAFGVGRLVGRVVRAFRASRVE